MQSNRQKIARLSKQAIRRRQRARSSLPVLLWVIWTIAVAATGYLSWHADMVAQRPLNTLGLVIHCVMVGAVGLVVLTKLQMWLEPWRFFGK
jgi:hypothetical protein